MKKIIQESVKQAIEAVRFLENPASLQFIEEAATMIADCLRCGNKVLISGNGGSLSDATHFAEELTGYFRKARRALPAIALSDPSHITCTANDSDFSQVFARGVEAYGKPGDVYIGLSTSGNSENILKAMAKARQQGLHCIALLGKGGGFLKGMADLELSIDGFSTSDRIQEAHMAAMHIIIEVIEHQLFYSADAVEAETAALQQ